MSIIRGRSESGSFACDLCMKNDHVAPTSDRPFHRSFWGTTETRLSESRSSDIVRAKETVMMDPECCTRNALSQR